MTNNLVSETGITREPAIPWGSMVRTALALVVVVVPTVAQAHPVSGAAGGLASGFLHPLTGLDHIVAMVAVGLWGAFLGWPAIWLLPVIFPVVMAVGGSMGIVGIPIPEAGIEIGIALSGVMLGGMVLFAARPPLWVAGVLVGLFAICHGYAHGAELPEAANPLTYAVGFVVATGLLHLAGIAFSLLSRWPWGMIAVRAGGGVIALIGFAFLFGVL